MAHFLHVKTAPEVLDIVRNLEPVGTETVLLTQACGRVLAKDARSAEPVPHFARATMDGYAVQARDVFGASESLPTLLGTIGDVRMGREPEVEVRPGTAVPIPTGGMMPEGANAVVMVEYTTPVDDRTIEVTRPVAPGDNVMGSGDDVAPGQLLVKEGRRLRPQDIGVLASVGISELCVYLRPRVAVISTGDEIVPVETRPVPPGKIRDINTWCLAAQARSAGAMVLSTCTIGDDLDALVSTVRQAMAECDAVLLSGGSSVGVRDFTMRILDYLEDAELLVHGVAVRPGKPTILARTGQKLFWGLPGQPVSAMMVSRAFVLPSLAALEGVRQTEGEEAGNRRAGALSRQIPSVHGRTDYVPVTLERGATGLNVSPVFGKSAMISTLSKSDGYIIIPENVEGLDAGTQVEVHLF